MGSNLRRWKKNKVECVFCPGPVATADHIPPKGLFTKPEAGWLKILEVPACNKCNNQSSLDDEWLQSIALTWAADGNADAEATRGRLMSAFIKPQKQGFRKGILKNCSPVVVAGRSTLEMTMNGDRLDRILSKLIKGMFWHQQKRNLPPDYQTMSHNVGQDVAEHFATVTAALQQLPETVVGEGAFAYRYHVVDENPNLTVWSFTFYGVARFIGYTVALRTGSATPEVSSP